MRGSANARTAGLARAAPVAAALLLWIGLCAAPCRAQVVFDAVGPSAAGTSCTAGSSTWTTFTCTWSHTVSGSANPALCVGATYSPVALDVATLTATFNGVAMTSEGHINSNNTSGAGTVYLFCMAAPASGAHSVAVTATYVSGTKSASDTIVGGSVSFTGVDQTTPIRNVSTSFGNGTSASVAVTSASGDLVIDAIGTGTSVTSSTQTNRWKDNATGASGAGDAAQSTAAGATSVTMAYAVGSDFWGMVGADVKAAAGGGGGTAVPPTQMMMGCCAFAALTACVHTGRRL
jgi:hypothetical protein